VPGLDPPNPRRTGTFRSSCGALRAVGRQSFANLAVSGAVADLDVGRPLDLNACGASDKLQLSAGETLMDIPAGRVFRPDYVALSSPAPVSLQSPSTGAPGRVLSQGSAAIGDGNHARLAVDAPGWLVLGESYSPGWRARCRDASGDDHDLGTPMPIDGFANGWRVLPGCTTASFAFAPQSAVDVAYLVSALAIIAMLVALAVPWLRRRRRNGDSSGDEAPVGLWARPPDAPARRYPLLVAIPVALVIGGMAGLVFALRAGPPLAIGALVLMLVGVSVGRLLLLALYGLVVIPIVYLADPLTNLGGSNFGYAQHFIGAHWVAVAVVCVLLGALVLWLSELRTTRQQPVSSDASPGPP